MKFRNLAACVIATMIGASPLAIAAPGGQTVVTKYKSSLVRVSLNAEAGGLNFGLNAQNYDDMDGVQQGYISAERYGFDPVTFAFVYSFVSCFGPAYANTVTVNRSTGASSVNVVLDPNGPGCIGLNSTTLNVAITGVPTGFYGRSDTGTSTFQYAGSMEKASFQSDGFDENFTGTIGYYTGAFSGNVETAKVTNRARVK